MALEQFRSNPDGAKATAWAKVGEIWITSIPLVDVATGLFASLGFDDALEAASLLGGRLPTPDELVAALAVGLLLHPVTLPTGDMSHGMTEAQAQALRVAHMMSREWHSIHDAIVRRALADIGWDGKQHVAGIGKHWVAGVDALGAYPPPGWAALFGWFRSRRPGDMWQALNNGRTSPDPRHVRHDRSYRDYSSTTHVVRTTAPANDTDLVAMAETLDLLEPAA